MIYPTDEMWAYMKIDIARGLSGSGGEPGTAVALAPMGTSRRLDLRIDPKTSASVLTVAVA